MRELMAVFVVLAAGVARADGEAPPANPDLLLRAVGEELASVEELHEQLRDAADPFRLRCVADREVALRQILDDAAGAYLLAEQRGRSGDPVGAGEARRALELSRREAAVTREAAQQCRPLTAFLDEHPDEACWPTACRTPPVELAPGEDAFAVLDLVEAPPSWQLARH